MSEIDVSKCAFYNNGECNNPNGMACNCCNNAYCYYKELQKLKAENEKLKQDLQEETKLGHKAICEEADRFFEVIKLQKVLDEIEKVAKNGVKDDCGMPLDELSIILKLIKQAKES